jgi:predicted NAD-dependent protein-ADP-ribosyltransferase YbiA (DUF1768 family)
LGELIESIEADIEKASGKKKNKILRPANVNIDSNFYGDRSSSERELALEAKFTQNEDMKQLLLATRNAKLMHFIRGQPAEPDHLLMKVRQKLR